MGCRLLVIIAVTVFIGATQAFPTELVSDMVGFRDKCIADSGSDEGYQQIMDSLEPAKACVLTRLDPEQLETDARLLDRGSRARKFFFNKYCPKFNKSISCFDETLGGISKCIADADDDASGKVKALLKTMAHNLLDLACQNGGELFMAFEEPEYKECFAQLKRGDADECKPSKATRDMSILKYGEKQCRELADTLECLKSKVDECDAPMLFDVFQVIYNAVSSATACKQYTILDENINNNISFF